MSIAIDDFDWIGLSKRVNQLLQYISTTTRAPINAEFWEEVIFHALKDMGLRYQEGDPKWITGSHSPGADLWVDELSISAKAGKITKDGLEISSYRLTRFVEIEEMIGFIDGLGKNFDVYLCCARTEIASARQYKVYMIPANKVNASDLAWTESYSKKSVASGWQGSDSNVVRMKIVRNMSNQLWITIPFDSCTLITELEVPHPELGSALDLVLKKKKS